MYEFKYSKISQLSTEKIQSSIAYLITSLENRLKENDKKLNDYEKHSIISSINHIKSGINVSININEIQDSPIDFSVIDKLLNDSKILGLPLYIYTIGSSDFNNEPSVPMSFSQVAINNLVELNNYLVDNNQYGLLFMEDNSFPELAWSFEEVINANNQIDAIVEFIKESKFSPFEAAAFIHQYITSQFEYKENIANILSPRSIVGVLNSDDIVCVGYSYLTKAIIDKLNMPGLECSTFTSKLKPRDEILNNEKALEVFKQLHLSIEGTGHIQNLIKIDDSLYNVKGNYVSDSCWDAKTKEFPSGKGIGNFMFPVEDLIHLKNQIFTQQNVKVEKMFEMIGLKRPYDPYSQPVISENIKNSKPIPLETYRKCLTNMFRKLSPDESELNIKTKVDYIMNTSSFVSYGLFNKDAIGSITQNAYKEIQIAIDLANQQNDFQPTL